MADLIVLCPGALVAPVGPRDARSPAWPRWLAHARPAARADDPGLVPAELPQEAWLRRYFGLDPASSVEAASAAIDLPPGQPRDQPVWRLTPVRLRLGVDHLVLDDPGHLSLSAGDSAQLADVVRPLFAQAGFELLAPDPGRWYLRGSRRPDWTPRSWRMAVGRNIDAYSPAGADARLWRQLVNEVQMSWHDHPVNLAREAGGLAPVNSLWLDGRFMPDRLTGASPAQVIGDNPALRGLAQTAGAPPPIDTPIAGALPPSALAVLRAAAHDLLLTCPAWREAEQDGSDESWRQAWQQFSQWLAPFASEGRPPAGYQRLRLVLCGDRRWAELDLLPGGRWAWWRNYHPDPLLEHRTT